MRVLHVLDRIFLAAASRLGQEIRLHFLQSREIGRRKQVLNPRIGCDLRIEFLADIRDRSVAAEPVEDRELHRDNVTTETLEHIAELVENRYLHFHARQTIA